MTQPVERDVVIVGAGPIGLELAVALRQAGVAYAQLEAGPIGSTLVWWAPQTRFFSSPERLEIAGVPLTTVDQMKITREQYLAYLRGIVAQFALEVHTHRRVVGVRREADRFVLATTSSGHGVGDPVARTAAAAAPVEPPLEYRCAALVLAIGNMHAPRELDIPGEDLPHVSHYLDEPHRYFGRKVLIVGGKNSAVEAALRLYRCGVDVTLSYRGDAFDPQRVKYWLRPEIEWLIDKGRIGWMPRTVPTRIERDHVQLAPVDAGGTPVAVPADAVLLLTGYVQDGTLFEQLGLERRGPGGAPVVDGGTMEASVPGVYIAGTAAGGTQQRARIFIENAHVHVGRIAAALTGRAPAWITDAQFAALEES